MQDPVWSQDTLSQYSPMQVTPQLLQLKVKAATDNKQTTAVHVQTRNRDCTMPTWFLLSSIPMGCPSTEVPCEDKYTSGATLVHDGVVVFLPLGTQGLFKALIMSEV